MKSIVTKIFPTLQLPVINLEKGALKIISTPSEFKSRLVANIEGAKKRYVCRFYHSVVLTTLYFAEDEQLLSALGKCKDAGMQFFCFIFLPY